MPLFVKGIPLDHKAVKVVADNRKAFHEYTIGEKLEAGIALTGTEVKSVREAKVNLSDGWVSITAQGEAMLLDVHIGQYSHGSYANHFEKRPRKLLLHKHEIEKLEEKISEKGLTVVPLKLYFVGSFVKVEIGVAKGKKLHDKREASKERDSNKEIQRAMRSRR